jgi:hypothetical protein
MNKKVLLTFYFGNNGLPLGHSCADGFRELGYEVICVNTHQKSFIEKYLFKPIQKIRKLFGLKPVNLKEKSWFWASQTYREICLEKNISKHRPDYVLTFNPNPGPYSLSKLIQLRDHYKFKLIGWNVDGPYEDLIQQSKVDSPHFDAYFCMHQHGYTSKDQIHYLPAFALDSKRYHHVARPTIERILFVGAMSPRRIQFLEALSDLNLEIYGTDWFKKGPNSLKCKVKGNSLWGEKLNQTMAESAIVLNISSWEPSKTGTSLRVIDIPACGAFMLTDETPEFHEIYSTQLKELTFENPSQLRKKILLYLNNVQKRENLRQRLYNECMQLPSYADRMRQIVSTTDHLNSP